MSKFSFSTVLTLVLLCVNLPGRVLAADCAAPGEGASDAAIDAYYACLDGDGGSDGSGGGSDDVVVPDPDPVVTPITDPAPVVEVPPAPTPDPDPVFPRGSAASRLATDSRVELSQEDGDAINEAALRLERLTEALSAPLTEASVLELQDAEESFAEAVSATIRAIEHSDYTELWSSYAMIVSKDKNRETIEGLFPEISFLRNAIERYPFDDDLFDKFMSTIKNVRLGNPTSKNFEEIRGGKLGMPGVKDGDISTLTWFIYVPSLVLEREVLLAQRARKNARSFASVTIDGQLYKADGTAFKIYYDDPSDYDSTPVLKRAIKEQREITQQRVTLDHIRKTITGYTESNPQIVFIDAKESVVDGKTEVTYEFTIAESALAETLELIAELSESDESIDVQQALTDLNDNVFTLNSDLNSDADGQPREEKTPEELAYGKFTFSVRLGAEPSLASSELKLSQPESGSSESHASVATLVDRLVNSVVDDTLFKNAPINPNDLEANREFLSLEPADNAAAGLAGLRVARREMAPPSGLSSAAGLNLGSVTTTDSMGVERQIGGVSINDAAADSSVSARTGVSLAEWLKGGDESAGVTAPLVSKKSAARSVVSVNLPSSRRFIPLMTAQLYAVSPNFPSGLHTLADGTMLAVKSGLGGRLVVAPLDLKLLEDGFASMGDLVYNAPLAQLRVVKEGQVVLSAAPSLSGVRARTGDAVDSVWSFPGEGDESSLDYTLEVHHPAGIIETLQPVMLDSALIRSVNSVDGLSLSVDRATGVIDVSGMQFRPSYTTSALRAGEAAYLDREGDAAGVAYYLGDRNKDGIQDVTIYTSLGKQVLYGVKD